MRSATGMLGIIGFSLLSGCAHIDFGGDGMTYFDPKPYLFVSTTKECVSTATVIMLPNDKKVMKFESGYGSASLTVVLSNGMIASVGQNTDTKIPETLSSIAGLGTAAAGIRALTTTGKQIICAPTAILYPIVSGVPDLNHPLLFPISKQTVDVGNAGQ
ncbi:MAG TPA: hypothetical protein VNF46_06995 [Gammaproteobacteria bacterium]|nr:hypothetical protein [Gammaproteobacteria bacterium]